MAESLSGYFQVSVNYIIFMHIHNSLQCLTEKSEGLRLSEDGFCVLVVEEVAILCVVHDHVDAVIFQECVPEFDDVWVIDETVNGNLSLEQFDFSI